jgi:hypothetical protein
MVRGLKTMSAAVDNLFRAFQGLPEAAKHELASAILRWEAAADHPLLTDDEFVAGADAPFLTLDGDEESHG